MKPYSGGQLPGCFYFRKARANICTINNLYLVVIIGKICRLVPDYVEINRLIFKSMEVVGAL